MRVGSELASIFHGKWDQDVLTAVRCGNRLRGGHVYKELPILRLFGHTSRNYGYLMEHCVFVDCGDDRIDDEVANVGKKASATTSPGLERSAARNPRASSKMAASGTPASLRHDLMTPTRSEWSRCRMPLFMLRTTCRSRNTSATVWMPHWGQCCIVVKR